MINVF